MFGCSDCYAVYSARGAACKTRRVYDGSNCSWGSKWHRLCRHVWPHLVPSFFLLVAQQFVSMLLLLMHLGLLQLFFGGTISYSGDVDSVTKEWTGLIGKNFRHLTTHTWIVLIPMFFYSLTILTGNLISNSLQGSIGIGNLRRKKVEKKEEKVEKQMKSEREDFSFYQEVSK